MNLKITDTLISVEDDALSVEYVKKHVRAVNADEDDLIKTYIAAAVSYFEEQTGRQVTTATREAWLDAFPFLGSAGRCARIELPHPPLQSVVSVKYIDSNGALQSFVGGSPAANLYRVTAPVGPYSARGFVEPLFGGTWPIARDETGAVRIQYTCGYGSDLPSLVSGILCFLVGHFYEFREAVVEANNGQITTLPLGVQQMMDGFKYSALPSQMLRSGVS